MICGLPSTLSKEAEVAAGLSNVVQMLNEQQAKLEEQQAKWDDLKRRKQSEAD